jgi:hypothetical protein
MGWSPIFVATFADSETVRMTTHCRSKLDWKRGRGLAKHAWQTRDRRHQIETRDRQQRTEKFLANLKDREPPEIMSCHFEVDGQVIEEPKEAPDDGQVIEEPKEATEPA